MLRLLTRQNASHHRLLTTAAAAMAGDVGCADRTTFDYLVIGGGSGGIASARRAAEFGARVALVESKKLGGTCVNVGCVPKKVMFNAAMHAEHMHDLSDYGFNTETHGFNWGTLKKARDEYIARLNNIYARNLEKGGVEKVIHGNARFIDAKGIEVNGETFYGRHILIATGGRPVIPDNIPGAHLGIDSDGFFELGHLPKKTVIVGAGYIAVELAGILNKLGSDVSLLIRFNHVLRNFDSLISTVVTENLQSSGVNILKDTHVSKVTRANQEHGTLTVETNTGILSDVDCLIWAVGRTPNVDFGLEKVVRRIYCLS